MKHPSAVACLLERAPVPERKATWRRVFLKRVKVNLKMKQSRTCSLVEVEDEIGAEFCMTKTVESTIRGSPGLDYLDYSFA